MPKQGQTGEDRLLNRRLRMRDPNSNDVSNVGGTLYARISEQVRLPQKAGPSQQSHHPDHHNNDITPGPQTCTYHSTPSSHNSNTHQDLTRPTPVYLSPHHSHQSSPPTSSSVTLNECCAPLSAQAHRPKRKMGLSKEKRIGILLGIDSVFFLIELVVGKWAQRLD